MSGFTRFFFSHENEFNDLEKPDGLRFVREAQFERFGNGLINPRLRVRTLYKGGLAVFDYSEPSEHEFQLSYTRRVNLASAGGV